MIPQTSSGTRNEWRSSECDGVCSCVRDSFAASFDGCTEARGVCASLSVVRNSVIKTIPLHTARASPSFVGEGEPVYLGLRFGKPWEGHRDGMKAGRAGRAGRGMASGNEWRRQTSICPGPGGSAEFISTCRPHCVCAELSGAGRKKPFLRSSDLASNPPVNHFALPPKQIQRQPLLQASTTPPRAASLGSPPSPPPPRSALWAPPPPPSPPESLFSMHRKREIFRD